VKSSIVEFTGIGQVTVAFPGMGLILSIPFAYSSSTYMCLMPAESCRRVATI